MGDITNFIFQDLYRNYYAYIFRLLQGLSGDADLAEDLTQDTFMRIQKALESFDPEKGNFKAWSGVIARNVFYRHMEKVNRRGLSLVESEVLEGISVDDLEPAGEWERGLTVETLMKALNNLGEPERSIIVCKFFKKKTIKETAEALKISESSVTRKTMGALKLLKAELLKEGIDSEGLSKI